jgi:hypothetical protein
MTSTTPSSTTPSSSSCGRRLTRSCKPRVQAARGRLQEIVAERGQLRYRLTSIIHSSTNAT